MRKANTIEEVMTAALRDLEALAEKYREMFTKLSRRFPKRPKRSHLKTVSSRKKSFMRRVRVTPPNQRKAEKPPIQAKTPSRLPKRISKLPAVSSRRPLSKTQ